MKRPLVNFRPFGPIFSTSRGDSLAQADLLTRNTIEHLSFITQAPKVDVLYDNTIDNYGIVSALIDVDGTVIPIIDDTANGRVVTETTHGDIIDKKYDDLMFIVLSSEIVYTSTTKDDVGGLHEWLLAHEYSHIVQEYYKDNIDKMFNIISNEDLITLDGLNESVSQSSRFSISGKEEYFDSMNQFIVAFKSAGPNTATVPAEQFANTFANLYTNMSPQQVQQLKENRKKYSEDFNEMFMRGKLSQWGGHKVMFTDSIFSIERFDYKI